MMRSMYSGVSGLRVHQTKMDVIGNNISNVNTAGFKASRTLFNEVFSQNLQNASGPTPNLGGRNPMQIGLGASVSTIDINMNEGASQRTDLVTDLKIEGEGFFVVKNADGIKFTRAGAFRVDVAGNLVNPAGMFVMGWQPDPDKPNQIQKGEVTPLKVLSAENMYSAPVATTKGMITGNINKNDSQVAATAQGAPITLNFYDSQGYPYTAQFRVKQSTATPGTYEVKLEKVTDQNSVDVTTATNPNLSIDPATVNLVFDAAGNIADPTAAKFTIKGGETAFKSKISDIEVDFSKVTQYSGNTTIQGLRGDRDKVGAGNMAGEMSGYQIGGDGRILAKYSNGDSKLLGQIVIADFDNPAGLQKEGNNLFGTTMNSGEFNGIGKDATAIGSTINSGVLEMSNVDLSLEFTEMITTQRGFQANSRVITTSDEILQELVNLKR
ncbi:flagellar hook protein FlgE [Clostridiales bacterium COT073_COT-073]|nr:flagellar hook protein FlgE [Clostridiales bacterium COT073_COT-073]